MSYEGTTVAVSDSQSAIRKLVYGHEGTGISFISKPPKEGFEALVRMGEKGYHIRVMATCKELSPRERGRVRATEEFRTREERRVWRVLYWHLKAMFEAADSGVIAIEDVIMPYVVTPDGRTIAEHIAPKMAEMLSMTHERLLQTSLGG